MPDAAAAAVAAMRPAPTVANDAAALPPERTQERAPAQEQQGVCAGLMSTGALLCFWKGAGPY